MRRSIQSAIASMAQGRLPKMLALYLIGAWSVLLGAREILEIFEAPPVASRALAILAISLLPLVLVYGWWSGRNGVGEVRLGNQARNLRQSVQPTKAATLVAAKSGAREVLSVTWKDSSGEHQELFDTQIEIGRGSNCDLQFHDPTISRHHTRLSFRGGYWTVADLGSTNGTLIDGKEITTERLPPRCELKINKSGPTLVLELVELEPEQHTVSVNG